MQKDFYRNIWNMQGRPLQGNPNFNKNQAINEDLLHKNILPNSTIIYSKQRVAAKVKSILKNAKSYLWCNQPSRKKFFMASCTELP